METELPELKLSVNPIKGTEIRDQDTPTATQPLLDARQDSFSMNQGILRRGEGEGEDEDGSEREPAPAKVRFLSLDAAPVRSFEPRSSPPSRGRSILLSKNKGRDTSSRPSVFERLSQMDTVASIQRRLVSKELLRKRASSAPPLRPISAPTLRSLNNRPPKVTSEFKLKKNSDLEKNIHKPNKVSPDKASFERLAGRHTKLSMMRQQTNRKNVAQRSGVLRVRSTSRGRPPALERWKSAPAIGRQRIEKEEEESVCAQSVISAGPPLEIGFTSRMEIFTTNTLRPEDGFDQVDCSELGLNGCLAEYEAGGLSVKEVASEIVNTMFVRDLPDNVDWSIKEPLHRELELPLGEKGFSFFIEANEEKEEGDNKGESDDGESPYSAASATGNVVFIHDLYEIHVENFSFVCGI